VVALKKPSDARSVQDLGIIVRALSTFRFFKGIEGKLNDGNWLKFSMYCEIEEFQPLEPICRIRDPSNDVFFIIQGDVAITKEWRSRYDLDKLLEHSLATITKGHSVGELGVIYNSQRSASCIPITVVRCIRMPGKHFQNVIGYKVRNYNSKRFSVLTDIHLFSNMDKSTLGGILNYIKILFPSNGSYIYKTGDIDQNIYIVITGELEFTYNYYIKKQSDSIRACTSREYTEKHELSLIKLYKGNYFGDENGLLRGSMNSKKGFNVKVNSENCVLHMIPKHVSIT